jgi:hypothetical protein
MKRLLGINGASTMRRLMMRRIWLLLLVMVTALAVAAPAIGKNPPVAPSPIAAPLAVYVDAGPLWVHEAGDIITYTVNVENKDRSSDASVSVTTDFDTVPRTLVLEGGDTGSVVFSRTVIPSDFLEGEAVGTVTVAYIIDEQSGTDIVERVSTVAVLYEPCIENGGGFTDVLVKSGNACIWKPITVGDWQVTAVPPPGVKFRAQAMTMRDHVPGNWCTPDGSGGGVYERWGPKDEVPDLLLDVFIPPDGVCLGGGAGGATMPVGNTDSFYLWVRNDALVTIQQVTSE